MIRQRVEADIAKADLVVTPRPFLEDLAQAGKVDGATIATLGLVSVGVCVRNGDREPDLGSVEGFVQSLLSSAHVIYNTASSGQYVAGMLEKLGLVDRLREKSSILPTGVAVMETLAADRSGTAIAFGHVTEIRRHDALGTHLAGTLPGAIGRETPYAIGLLQDAARPEEARRLIAFLTSPEGKRIFVDNGVL